MRLGDLEKYRGNDGFIDFDRIDESIGIKTFSPKREVRGTETREKMWLHLDDATVLLKTVEENTNLVGTCYAEMITSELAKQAGLDVARVDLIKYKGYCGVISQKVNKENEQLHSLREYIGDEEIENDPFPEITGLEFVVKKLANYLNDYSQMTKTEKYAILQSLLKLMVFDTIVISTDRHTENISFIEKTIDGKKQIFLAPLYDNEFSLMLETKAEDLEQYLQNANLFYGFVDAQEPKISPKFRDTKHHYLDLAEEIINMDDDVELFMSELIQELDIKNAIKSVEKHIGAEIPEVYKNTAIYAYSRRKRELENNLLFSQDIEDDFDEK